MKKIITLSLVAIILVALTGCLKKDDDLSDYKVAIVKQLDHASLDEIAKAICDELDTISKEKGIVIDYGDIYSGQNDQSVLQQIGSQILSDGVDVIIPIGTLAAQTMTAISDGNIPIVYAAISDPLEAGLTDLDYVTGTSDALNTEKIMDMLFEVNPNAKKIGLLYSLSETNSKKAIEEAKKYLETKGVEIVEATGNSDDEIKQAAASLIASNVDAVFTPTDNVVMASELSIAQEFLDAKIPHYTGADSFVRNGAFVTCGVNYTDLGKQTADLAYKVMKEGIGAINGYEVVDGNIITVNNEALKALNVDPYIFSKFGDVVLVDTSRD